MGEDTPELRKARGAFFTPPEVAAYLASWAIRARHDRVLEPAAGEAAFLTAADRRLRDLGGDGSTLDGVELHEVSADRARSLLDGAGRVLVGDFFDVDLAGPYDAVVGNPPYIRYQAFAGRARTAAQEAALSHGVRLTGLSSSWAAFVVRAAGLLAPAGRLALVLPAELMAVAYAAQVRRFLLARFASVRLVTFERLMFDDALEDVVLLLAEGQGPTDRFEVFQARDADDLPDAAAAGWATSLADGAEKWSPALLAPDVAAAYRDAVAGAGVGPLTAWGKPYLGGVTGNNRWFTLTAAHAEDAGLTTGVLERISPPGSRHLRGLELSEPAWRVLRDEGRAVYLFRPPDVPLDELADPVRRRVEEGEAAGVHRAYKCRVRSPWWRVPLPVRADLLLTYMNHDTPRLVANSARVAHLNSVHGVTLHAAVRDAGRELLPLAALNSVTLLGAELVGRAYGGGMLKLEPGEATRLPLPSPQVVDDAADELRSLRPQLAGHLRGGRLEEAVRRVDAVLRPRLGLDRAAVAAMRAGRDHLFGRRVARGRS